MRKKSGKINYPDELLPLFIVKQKGENYTQNCIQQTVSLSFQVLNGDIDEAICSHALYYSIWRKYESLPERYNWYLRAPDVLFYPLRPELVESTYFLYQATKNPFYLHVGKDILDSINVHAKAW